MAVRCEHKALEIFMVLCCGSLKDNVKFQREAGYVQNYVFLGEQILLLRVSPSIRRNATFYVEVVLRVWPVAKNSRENKVILLCLHYRLL